MDLPVNLGAASDTDTQKLYHAFLRVSSLTKTKRLPALSLLHVGMEVRLTTTLEMPYAVQDATATVLEIHFANNEDQVVQRRRTGNSDGKPATRDTPGLASSSYLGQAP